MVGRSHWRIPDPAESSVQRREQDLHRWLSPGGLLGDSQGHNGRGQYVCDTTYGATLYGDYSLLGSGSLINVQCTMNRGSSGGPWFVPLRMAAG